MDININISFPEHFTMAVQSIAQSLLRLAHPLVSAQMADTPAVSVSPAEKAAVLQFPVKTELPQTGLMRADNMPIFATEDAKRAWLLDQLKAKGVDIPARVRTTTLEKKYLELQANPSANPAPISAEPESALNLAAAPEDAGGEFKDPFAQAAENPAPASTTVAPASFPVAPVSASAATAPPPAADSTATKESVTDVLRTFVTGAKDEPQRQQRRDKVLKRLKECGAANVTELKPEHYATIIKEFTIRK